MTRRLRTLGLIGAVLAAAVGCGKKGPPLPPLVRLPAAPAEIGADRRGSAVDVRFVLPSANTDGSRPANIQRVDVYALDGTAAASEAEVLKSGTRIGSVDVKAPRDPNVTVDADEPDADVEPLEGPGVDQGASAHVRDLLTAASLGGGATRRTYVGVSITTRGRRGPLSKAVAVTLAPAPATPPEPKVSYTETAVTVSWDPLPAPEADSGASLAYHVYDASPAAPSAGAPTAGATARGAPGAPVGGVGPDRRLSQVPVEQPTYADTRIAWNVERCYVVRAVWTYELLSVESDASPAGCTVLADTFPPAAPTGVTAVASEGTINLIWTPNAEPDLAGYRVLRAALPSGEMTPITPAVLSESSFSDHVQAGVRYVYAVQALDTAGNVSASSERVEETAR